MTTSNIRKRISRLTPDARKQLAQVLSDLGVRDRTPAPDAALVAYLTPRAGQTIDVSEIRNHLDARIPGYMVPAVFVELDALPRTPNGKVDKGALPDPSPNTVADNHEFVRPQTEVEIGLAEIWASLLGFDEISVHDDFFELGGHSLLAIRLVEEVYQRFGVRLSVADLFGSASIGDIASLIQDTERDGSLSAVVPLETGGTGIPVFCVHSWTGDVLPYRNLARHLGETHPVFGVQAVGVGRESVPQLDIETMARDYVGEVVRAVPHGPIALVGWCFSVVLALEMARELQSQGREVAMVLNVDTGKARIAPVKQVKDVLFYIKRARNLRGRFGTLGLIRYGLYKVRVKLGFVVPTPVSSESEPDASARIEEATTAAYDAYFEKEHEPFAGTMTVLLSPDRGNVPAEAGPVQFWQDKVAGIQVQKIGGGHTTTLLEPHVRELASAIKLGLKQPSN